MVYLLAKITFVLQCYSILLFTKLLLRLPSLTTENVFSIECQTLNVQVNGHIACCNFFPRWQEQLKANLNNKTVYRLVPDELFSQP